MDTHLGSTYEGGEGGIWSGIDDFAKKWVGEYYMAAFGIIIVLSIMVLWMSFKKESFNPGQLMNFQAMDGLGQRSPYETGREHMDGAGPAGRDSSAFAQLAQDQAKPGATFTVDPNAQPGQPGSLGWQITHSGEFGCGNKPSAPSDSWQWMLGVASGEHMTGRPTTDNSLSKILAGH